ncbi:dihydrofolate reductase [Acetoanaerobium pronyense]|uniref:dihydrofolate reductase n=1 Tax=Acetoanaerobium pronyense TaxID=1482736 RepID=A0ABS4KJE0_9FIRM|nr:dihydrofolate reductase [Acetoanaerobium pronyense]MBP2027911.1 dihydrofolate reductase [Acetoanaerobium pronyense]
MKAIVAVDLNWGIGCAGELLEVIPEDMKFFKEKTIGKVLIMGRGTFDSLPGRAPLKDRLNIVLSKDYSFEDSRLTVCRSLDEVFENIKGYDTKDIYVIGGQSVFTQFMPYCTEAYVTKIHKTYSADKYFPNLYKEDSWELVSESEIKEFKSVEYNFLKYRKK